MPNIIVNTLYLFWTKRIRGWYKVTTKKREGNGVFLLTNGYQTLMKRLVQKGWVKTGKKKNDTLLCYVKNTSSIKHACCELFYKVEQCRDSMVIMAEQSCSTNIVVHNCFNYVVQHWWSNNGCSRLLKQEKTILIEQINVVCCVGRVEIQIEI